MTNVSIFSDPAFELILTRFQMPQNDNFVRFGIATATICLPSYLIIFSFASERWLERYDRWWKKLMAMLFIKTESNQLQQGFWTGLFRTSSQPPPRQRRQSAHHLTGVRKGSRAAQQGNLRPSLTRDLTIGSGSVKFDLPSYGNGAVTRSKRMDRTLTSQLEKSPSDPGPLSALPEEGKPENGSIRRGLLRSLTEHMSGQNSPRSPV